MFIDTPDNEHRISAVNDEGSDDNNKANIYKGFKRVDKGSSGVELRYHAFKEYKKLPKTKYKNSDYGEARDPTGIQTKVKVADNPRNKRIIQGSRNWKHIPKTLTTRSPSYWQQCQPKDSQPQSPKIPMRPTGQTQTW